VEELRGILRKYWGYDEFRPLQAEAMRAVVAGRDSVVVLPTGGGKSLCFQAPALHLPGLAVVVSPLISLMKDQVDALADCGVPATCVNSTVSADEQRRAAQEIRNGVIKLLYLSPERLMTDRMLEFLRQARVAFFAIDEAHCISDWGHDFRPEYRALRVLKDRFPGIPIHAYTATATDRVRNDIARELRLDNPEMLVGSFDRPNLVYRVQRRSDLVRQVRTVIEAHRGDSGIIYCIRRADVDSLCADLNAAGFRARPYHAGMDDQSRRDNQEAFIKDRAEIIVATVAFGMGIDKSDVRYVIHAAAPKSLESYQQESGRAGRDGLEAECWLFHSGGDFRTWRTLQSDLPAQAHEIAMTVLAGIESFCTSVVCRHRAILQYFGQDLAGENCGACDVCLAELDLVDDAVVLGQKILSCVVRLKENYGGEYTALVLAGSREQRILDNGHDHLSTWGLLADENKRDVRNWIEQLVGQGYLQKTGEYNVLHVTPAGWRVLRGEETPRLLKAAQRKQRESKREQVSWEGVDRELFEALRQFRRKKADERGHPPFVIFGDATLRELARNRPTTPQKLLTINGIGEKKCADFGPELLDEIAAYCRAHDLEMDVQAAIPRTSPAERPPAENRPASASRRRAGELFSQGKSIAEVAEILGRAHSTTRQYLLAHIHSNRISDPGEWIEAAVFEQVRRAVEDVGTERLKPIFEALNGAVEYDQIHIAVACLQNALASH
jgi:ATP-dependent DNA helicase RecQ